MGSSSLNTDDLVSVDPNLLSRLNVAAPRYTSYPTAPQFLPMDEGLYREKIASFDSLDKPLSLYIHIPFCKTMCLFCGCSVVLNRKRETQTAYVQHLLKEILQLPFSKKRKVTQLHLGGGTPTSLSVEEFELLMTALEAKFTFSPDAEISIEIDPRTVFSDRGEKLRKLRSMGFNRVSFGVQDLDPKVQEAVKRRQSEEMTVSTYFLARELGFLGINLDLIYGLPFQTPKSFAKTAERIIELKPDRIAFFSYAKVPWLKPHQKAIPEETLPTDMEKFTIYAQSRELFMRGGYEVIGMDHFSLPTDPLTVAYRKKQLTRNFQGYSLALAEDMIGLGVTAIGFLENSYFQNKKTITEYEMAIDAGKLPVERGYVLHEDDLRRAWVIQRMMCHFSVSKQEFALQFQIPFDVYFERERGEIERLKNEGLLAESLEEIIATSTGRLFIRLIAAIFDMYLKPGLYSKVV
jgi:oxygen-independent coproporphyrinogen III oxidase